VRATPKRWLLAACPVILACVMTVGCTQNGNPAAAPPPRESASGTLSQVPVESSSAPATSPSASAPVAVQNLAVTASVRRDLIAAYVAYKHFKSSDVAGAAPHSIYYAYDPANDTYWAMADFLLSSTASFDDQVEMQDGGNKGLFTRTASDSWQVRNPGFPSGCGIQAFFPKAVITVWALPTPVCPTAAPTT
jgi:hypothetical protein